MSATPRLLTVLILGLSLSCAVAQTISWQQTAPMPIGKGGQVCGVINGKVFVAGGTYWIDGEKKVWSGDLYVYHPDADTWCEGPAMPVPLSYGTGDAVDGKLYVVSGSDGARDYADVWICEPAPCCAKCKRAHAPGQERTCPHRAPRWVKGPSLPAPRIYSASAVVGSKLYVFGGAARNDLTGELYDSALVLDTDNLDQGWQKVQSMPGPGRTLMAAATVGTRIYLLGGYVHKGKDFCNSRDVLVYDTGSGSWGRLPRLPYATRCSDAAAVGGQLYVLGGYVEWRALADIDESFTDKILRLDPVFGTFTEVGKLPIPNCGVSPRLLPDGRLFINGGEDEKKHRSNMTAIGTVQ